MASKTISPIWSIIASVLSVLFERLSPDIKKAMKDFLKGLLQKAEATPNPIDDLLVRFLASLLGFTVD